MIFPTLTPTEVKDIRSRLGLDIAEAGRIIGGGPRAFFKYEMDLVTPSAGLCNLLRLLDASPTLLKVLKNERLQKEDTEAVADELIASSDKKGK